MNDYERGGPALAEISAETPDLARAVDWARTDGTEFGDRLKCGERAHELCVNVRNLLHGRLGAAPSAEANEIVAAIGLACANLLNKSAAFDATVNSPVGASFRNARPPIMVVAYADGPQLISESYARSVGISADASRAAFKQGGADAFNARILTEKSARDAKTLVGSLDGLAFYRADFDYRSGVTLRSNTVLSRRLDTREIWGSVRSFEDVTAFVKNRPDRRVRMERAGKIFGYDRSMPGLRWGEKGRQGAYLDFAEDVKNLPTLLRMVTDYQGAGDARERDIHEALNNFMALAVVMDHLWISTGYLMRLTDHNGLAPNASMADTFGMSAGEIAHLASIDASVEKVRDPHRAELAKKSGYEAHFYPEERDFLQSMHEIFARDGYYFESFPALTDNIGPDGKRIVEEISWDRYALHHPRLHYDRRNFVESMKDFHLTDDQVRAIAGADLRIGLPKRD